MKQIITAAIAITMLLSCVSKRETINTANSTMAYTIKDQYKTKATGTRLWILFIPIGIGANKYDTRKEKVLHRFMKQTGADAIMNGQIVDRKFIIPLILVNYSFRICTMTGKPCYFKTDTLKK